MIPSSVRRVVSTAPSSPALSNFASAAPRATAAYALSRRPSPQQRRYSSSKPSSPDNGPKDLPAGQSVPASSKSSSEKRKRRAKEPQPSAQKLPSVPSTQHLPLESLALSSFFSQHRPISITHSLPKVITEDAFASIFLPKNRAQKTSDVMKTLSKAVNDLEAPMAGLSLNGQQEGEQSDENVHKIEFKHLDGSESSIYVQLNAMSGQFLPFQPPPAPEPQAEVDTADAAESAAEQAILEDDVPHHRVYRAVLTIEEQLDANGQVKIVAHSPQIMEEPTAPRTFLERMAIRHLRYEDAQRQREKMMAISVLRRKKLKMKKKKYKKLMKKTRNLRRKLDRT